MGLQVMFGNQSGFRRHPCSTTALTDVIPAAGPFCAHSKRTGRQTDKLAERQGEL